VRYRGSRQIRSSGGSDTTSFIPTAAPFINDVNEEIPYAGNDGCAPAFDANNIAYVGNADAPLQSTCNEQNSGIPKNLQDSTNLETPSPKPELARRRCYMQQSLLILTVGMHREVAVRVRIFSVPAHLLSVCAATSETALPSGASAGKALESASGSAPPRRWSSASSAAYLHPSSSRFISAPPPSRRTCTLLPTFSDGRGSITPDFP
jgi:hypothetical protein